MLLAIVLTAACGSDNGYSTSNSAATSAGTTAPGQGRPSTPASSAPDPAVTGDTAAPGTDDVPGAANEIIVHVGVDDAATVGSRVENVKLGDHVVLRLVSDTDETYHVHGYDLEQKVAAGVEAQFEFTADRAGDFEVESHTTEKVYVVLHVS
jgi:hypothetical protein